MITPLHYDYFKHLNQEFWNTHKAWHPAHDNRSWDNYLLENFGIICRHDSMRGNWLDFKSDHAEAEFTLQAEKHQTWKALQEYDNN